jgi:hypothetical protein
MLNNFILRQKVLIFFETNPFYPQEFITTRVAHFIHYSMINLV